MAMQIRLGTGEIFSFLEMFKATGAIISTVATLSTKAETTPAKIEREMIAHFMFGIFSMIKSARSDGIFDSMKSATMPIVPAIIIKTFQSNVLSRSLKGRKPSAMKTTAEPKAM